MARTCVARAAIISSALLLVGCANPLDGPDQQLEARTVKVEDDLARQWRLDTVRDLDSGSNPAAEAEGQAVALPALGPDSSLGDYVRYASLNNAQLEAAFALWKAALERLPQVRALPDPMFTFGAVVQRVNMDTGTEEFMFGLAQMFPWFGKLELQEGVAAREAEAAFEMFRGQRLGAINAVRDAWYDRAGLEHEIRITRENIELVGQLERTARARYASGAAIHPDVVRLQIELEKLSEQLRTFEDRRRPIDGRLNATLNRPADAPVEGDFALPDAVLDADGAAIAASLREHNPDLRAAVQRIEAGRLATKLARTTALPDFTLGLDYTAVADASRPGINDNGVDPIVASVSINVPVWREKYDAAVREAIARRYAEMRGRADLENELSAQIEQTLYDYRASQRQIVLYRDTLLPKATQALEATLSAYQSGTATFLDLLEAQRELLDFELMHIRALTSRARHLALLDRLVGTDLPRITDANQPGGSDS
jgi:outer membrane protein TolC